ncbi:MAG: molybdenum-binding protein [Deltaproteobacteria bacterium]|nr:MAG: molybdenum-binding protein [Deltaproteobacteria bacterium]
MPMLSIGYRLWVEKDGVPVFGPGLFELLFLVNSKGSLHSAAKELRMSYRAAWGMVRVHEERLGISLLEKGRHGRTGAHLTEKGLQVLKYYEGITSRVSRLISSNEINTLLKNMEELSDSDDS